MAVASSSAVRIRLTVYGRDLKKDYFSKRSIFKWYFSPQ